MRKEKINKATAADVTYTVLKNSLKVALAFIPGAPKHRMKRSALNLR